MGGRGWIKVGRHFTPLDPLVVDAHILHHVHQLFLGAGCSAASMGVGIIGALCIRLHVNQRAVGTGALLVAH